MAKLFIFAIGGTGSRVVKALTMLLASGVKIENTEKIIPIIVDPDIANGDLTRTEEILRLYKHIQMKTISDKSYFFKIPINSLDENGKPGFVSEHFRYEIEGVKDNFFRDFIDYSALDKNNKAFASLLFSKDNLDANMDVGFKGNPNIGSVVLNKFSNSDFFHQFAESLGENDRIFIVSSIFGGTGAAGFPLILKNIRGAQPPIPNHVNLQNAKIGAITILPYFSVNDTGKKTIIDSNTFISKTKAALSYYARNVSGNQSLNALYYIGDQFTDNRIEGADGASEQKNNAHFIELASALAIIDFMSKRDDDFAISDGRVANPKYFEFGLKNSTETIAFSDLGNTSHDTIAQPLTQYSLFDIFFKQYFDSTNDKVYATNGNNKLKREFLDKRFVDDLKKFNQHFVEWQTEMAISSVSFQPINNSVSKKDILNLVKGSPEKINKWNPIEVRGHEAYIENLNETDKTDRLDALGDNCQKLMATFANATKRVISKKISL